MTKAISKYITHLLAIASLLCLCACSRDDEQAGAEKTARPISFRVGMSSRVSQAYSYMSPENIRQMWVTAFLAGDDDSYFTDIAYKRNGDAFISETSYFWPGQGDMYFFAYAPALSLMGIPSVPSSYDYKDYRLEGIKVEKDISRQIDFITSYILCASDNRENDIEKGVKLNFKHQLSRVELKGKSENKKYDIEVAGILIGRPVTCASYVFHKAGEGDAERWDISANPERTPVRYLFKEGDAIQTLGEAAVSLMGNGGDAMVIPTKNNAWRGKDRNLFEGGVPCSTDSWWMKDNANPEGDMYLSVLVRISTKNGNRVYPYTGQTENVVSIETDGTKITNTTERYLGEESNTLKHFAWAAIPVSVNWEKGKSYVYTLDFTNGVGIHAPDDKEPGTPIIGDDVSFILDVEDWEKEEREITLFQEDQ